MESDGIRSSYPTKLSKGMTRRGLPSPCITDKTQLATAEQEVDDEARIRIQMHEGSPQIRPGKRDFPLFTKLMIGLRRANDIAKKDPKFGWERDPSNHQTVIYISDPGYHVTYLIGRREKK